jgi:hypothetical protein
MNDKQIQKMIDNLVDISYRLADEIMTKDYDETIAPRLKTIIGYLRNKQFIRDQINELEGAYNE